MSYNPANPFDFLFSGANRSYNKVGAQNQSSFGLVYNPFYDNGAGVTGQWQPITTNNQGALRVDIGTGIQISATVDDIAITGGNINVNGFDVLTGQVAQLQVAVNTLTGTVSSKWQKAKTAGFAEVYGAHTGSCLVNKVQGYSKTSTIPSFIMIFDKATAPTPGDVPDFVVATQPNNWWINLAEAGVEFVNGLQIANSSDAAVYTPYGAQDFIANVVYKGA